MKTEKIFRLIISLALAAVLMCGLLPGLAEDTEWTPGRIVSFGRYPQTKEGTDETPIEWIVLDVDEENHRALLLSRYGLDVIAYKNYDAPTTWADSHIRVWLNGKFMKQAFSEEEQEMILLTDVDNSAKQGYSGYYTDSGEDTQDRIFLLSYWEVLNYFGVEYYKVPRSSNMRSRMAPTPYALEKGADTYDGNKTEEGELSSVWWLRSPGLDQNTAARVNAEGSLDSKYVYRTIVCARPALWIALH